MAMPSKPKGSKSSTRGSVTGAVASVRKSIFGGGPGEPLYADRLASTLKEGDIVLFYGKQIHDAVIRCCTGSTYNHVAMVVRASDGELELFEAAALGVGKVPLEFYINSYYWSHMRKMFHKVVIRQLHTKPAGRGISTAMRADLVRYQHEMLGRKFCLNPVSYMHALLSIPQREDMSTSFCSQLVAGAYKRMGLLPEKRAASNYLPRHFSAASKVKLPLQGGARLGPERELIFDETPMEAMSPTLDRPSYMPSMPSFTNMASGIELPASAEASEKRPHVIFKEETAESLGEVGWEKAPKKKKNRMSSMFMLAGGAAESPTAEELEERRLAAEAALRQAMALYKVRAWMRRVQRRKQREKQQLLSLQEGSGEEEQPASPNGAADTPAAPGQVAVEIRRD